MKGVADELKPFGTLSGTDLYGLIGEVSILLEQNDLSTEAAEFVDRAIRLATYDEVLALSRDYIQLENGE